MVCVKVKAYSSPEIQSIMNKMGEILHVTIPIREEIIFEHLLALIAFSDAKLLTKLSNYKTKCHFF